jgi:hypothetical protein
MKKKIQRCAEGLKGKAFPCSSSILHVMCLTCYVGKNFHRDMQIRMPETENWCLLHTEILIKLQEMRKNKKNVFFSHISWC